MTARPTITDFDELHDVKAAGITLDDVVLDDDARLSDQRTPVDGSVSTAKLANGAVTAAKVAADVATQAELDAEAASRVAGDALAVPLTQKGVANGVATLGSDGLVPASQLTPFQTQITATVGFIHKMRKATADAAILILSDSTGTSLGPANNPWPNQLAALIAAAYPAWTVKLALWADGSGYPAASTVAAGSGPRTLTIYNMSVSGKSTNYYQAANFAAGVAATSADLVIVSQGHNETTTINDLFRARYIALTEQVRLACPKADTLCVAQNPHTDSSGTMDQWAIEIAKVCALRGYGFVNVYDLFLNHSTWAADWMVNATHPNNTGQTQIANELLRFLVLPSSADIDEQPRTSPPSSFTELAPSIGLANTDFASFDGSTAPTPWVLSGVTVSKDLTNYESPNGYAVKLTAAAGSGQMHATISAKRWAGKWVTFAVRMRIPSGANQGVGRMAVADNGTYSVGSIVANAGAPQGGYFWNVVTKFISTDATTITLYIYATDSSATGGGNISVDRVSLTEGLLPREGGASGPTGPAGASGKSRADLANSIRNVVAETIPWGAIGQAASSTGAPPSGELTGCVVGLQAGDVVKGIAFSWTASGLTLSYFAVGLYDKSGNLLASSDDVSGTIGATGAKEIAFTSPYTVTADDGYYLAFLGVFSAGSFSIQRGAATSYLAVAIDSGKTPLVKQTGRSTLPSPATFAAGNTNNIAYYLAAYS